MLSEAGISKCYLLIIYKGILFTSLQYINRLLSPRKPNEIFKEINCFFLEKSGPSLNRLNTGINKHYDRNTALVLVNVSLQSSNTYLRLSHL
jgi:hypothetical protein